MKQWYKPRGRPAVYCEDYELEKMTKDLQPKNESKQKKKPKKKDLEELENGN